MCKMSGFFKGLDTMSYSLLIAKLGAYGFETKLNYIQRI